MPKGSKEPGGSSFYTRNKFKHEKGANYGASFLLNAALAFFANFTAVMTRFLLFWNVRSFVPGTTRRAPPRPRAAAGVVRPAAARLSARSGLRGVAACSARLDGVSATPRAARQHAGLVGPGRKGAAAAVPAPKEPHCGFRRRAEELHGAVGFRRPRCGGFRRPRRARSRPDTPPCDGLQSLH